MYVFVNIKHHFILKCHPFEVNLQNEVWEGIGGKGLEAEEHKRVAESAINKQTTKLCPE